LSRNNRDFCADGIFEYAHAAGRALIRIRRMPAGIRSLAIILAKTLFRKSDADTFWDQHSDVADDKGCFVFAMKAAKGSKPVYVVQATKSFRQETFETHKREKLNDALANQKKGKLVVYFMTDPLSST
jgi:hypothetical protein